MDWKIYYADGATFSSENGNPEDASGLGVEVIIQVSDDPHVGAYLQHGDDYYVWWDSKWWGCDEFSLFEYLFVDRFSHGKVALKGKMLGNTKYNKLIRLAKVDKDFF